MNMDVEEGGQRDGAVAGFLDRVYKPDRELRNRLSKDGANFYKYLDKLIEKHPWCIKSVSQYFPKVTPPPTSSI